MALSLPQVHLLPVATLATSPFPVAHSFSSPAEVLVVPPIPSTSALPEASSTLSEDIVTIVSSGSAQYTISGSTYTITGDGSEGVIPPPSATGGSAGFTTSNAISVIFSAGGEGGYGPQPSGSLWVYPTVSSGSGNFTVSTSVYIAVSTGADGIITPTLVTHVSTLASQSI
jgi:hypothetical protein